ncbi:hypothetical protein [Magnetofaba australis]|uniref:hypothetical protein n=1 Tax=Magnetofaba australis TaxID=1472297 RepID=UPI000A19C63F|nr:hypothetical protein [Magnetofaba australis]
MGKKKLKKSKTKRHPKVALTGAQSVEALVAMEEAAWVDHLLPQESDAPAPIKRKNKTRDAKSDRKADKADKPDKTGASDKAAKKRLLLLGQALDHAMHCGDIEQTVVMRWAQKHLNAEQIARLELEVEDDLPPATRPIRLKQALIRLPE